MLLARITRRTVVRVADVLKDASRSAQWQPHVIPLHAHVVERDLCAPSAQKTCLYIYIYIYDHDFTIVTIRNESVVNFAYEIIQRQLKVQKLQSVAQHVVLITPSNFKW